MTLGRGGEGRGEAKRRDALGTTMVRGSRGVGVGASAIGVWAVDTVHRGGVVLGGGNRMCWWIGVGGRERDKSRMSPHLPAGTAGWRGLQTGDKGPVFGGSLHFVWGTFMLRCGASRLATRGRFSGEACSFWGAHSC